MLLNAEIDVLENTLRRNGDLLDILLFDQTTRKNIIWGTDSYINHGSKFAPTKHMKSELVTGKYGKLIQPRAIKSREEQLRRTKERGEVFTPLRIVRDMNGLIDQNIGGEKVIGHTWQDYIREQRLEIACGEAPFIVSRYNPVAHGAIIKLKNRVGFLDYKLRVVSHYCDNPKEWLAWAKIAFQSSYGYEWQGDSLLIARENLLYTLIDYYRFKFNKIPTLTMQQEFAEIISWNIFQMDGTKYVIPLSCHNESHIVQGDLTLFGKQPDTIEDYECEGCKFNRPTKHNGKYVNVLDWASNQTLRFLDILK